MTISILMTAIRHDSFSGTGNSGGDGNGEEEDINIVTLVNDPLIGSTRSFGCTLFA